MMMSWHGETSAIQFVHRHISQQPQDCQITSAMTSIEKQQNGAEFREQIRFKYHIGVLDKSLETMFELVHFQLSTNPPS